MYVFTPKDSWIRNDPLYPAGAIPVYHDGFQNSKEPFTLSVTMNVTGPNNFNVEILEGFRYDNASIPWVFQRVLPKTHPKIWRAALVHDWLYYNRIGKREDADKIFLDILKQDGLDWIRRNAAYKAVRLFGKSAWEDDD